MSIRQAFLVYSEYLTLRNRSKKTISNYKLTCECLVRCLGDVDVEDLDLRDVHKFTQHMIAAGFKSSTVQNYVSCLRRLIRRCEAQGINVMDIDEIRAPRAVKRVPRYLDPDQVRLIIDSEPDARNKAMLALAFSTGARNSEIINIKLTNISGNRVLLETTKTGVERYVYLSSEAIGYMRSYLEVRDSASPYLFVSYRRTRLGPNSLNYLFKQAGDRVGIHLHPHMMRHSMATQFLRASNNIRYVQRALGHAKLQSTEMYTHVADQDVLDAHRLAFV